jgi:hypothetical protein
LLERWNLALVGRNLAQAMVGRDSVRSIRGHLRGDRRESCVKIPIRSEALFLNISRCSRLGATLAMAYNWRGIYFVVRYQMEHSV